MIKILIVFGTRPEAIKMAPLVKAFKERRDFFDTKVCVTAQHRHMLDQVLDFFEIIPDYDLDLMKPDQSLNSITADILVELKPILEDFNPTYVIVHGDTSTSTAAAFAAFYSGCKVVHIEAGLRTFNKLSPFPEEMNRQITGRLADIHFAPTAQSRNNLLLEGIEDKAIVVTGNTVIDALMSSVYKVNSHLYSNSEITKLRTLIDPSKDIILVTGHRRENFGQGFINICEALREISQSAKVQIIYPVHLNPNVKKPVFEILQHHENILLIDPLSYPSFIWLMDKAKIIITDSGGLQEEAPSLGKPVLVMRDTTERPEAIDAGTAILVGTDKKKIIRYTLELLTNKDIYNEMSSRHNPYGDGFACNRIIDHLIAINS
jgi:UDP-N-acetylglucosamine 2-epimerase (non-hydrolysing)